MVVRVSPDREERFAVTGEPMEPPELQSPVAPQYPDHQVQQQELGPESPPPPPPYRGQGAVADSVLGYLARPTLGTHDGATELNRAFVDHLTVDMQAQMDFQGIEADPQLRQDALLCAERAQQGWGVPARPMLGQIAGRMLAWAGGDPAAWLEDWIPVPGKPLKRLGLFQVPIVFVHTRL
jgi:hypothetical protein